MSVIHTYLSANQVRRLSQRDNDYLRRRLQLNCMLNSILHRHVNRPLLAELRCVLDSKPIPRRKTEQYRKNSKVRVYDADGVLIRIEHGNGKVMKLA